MLRHPQSIFLLVLAPVRISKRTVSHVLTPMLSFYSKGNGRMITLLRSSRLRPGDHPTPRIFNRLTSPKSMRLPRRIYANHHQQSCIWGREEERRRHVWRPVNMGRIMGKSGHAVANVMKKATTRGAVFAVPIWLCSTLNKPHKQ